MSSSTSEKHGKLLEPKFTRSAAWPRLFKPALDRFLAAAALVALSPLLLLLYCAVKKNLGSPALFRQTRIGLSDQPFLFLKFRTMTSAVDAAGALLPDSARLTPFGRFLRASSLDELPQLWNVLKGDMSLVGPRPLLPEYLPRYSAFQRRRHEVRPGITGWAQVKGRNAISWEEKFALDVWYVDRCSFALDVAIVWLTLRSLAARDGISQPGHATMPVFMGSAGTPRNESRP